MNGYSASKMLSRGNMFRFECPIFQTTVEARTCFKITDLHMRGTPHPKRPGCSACITGSKCPTRYMIHESMKTTKDIYFAAQPSVGALSQDILDRIAPIMVLEHDIARFGASPAEANAIREAVTSWEELDKERGIKRSKPGKGKRRNVSRSSNASAEQSPETPESRIDEAVQSGDMGAAINKAMKDAA